MCKAHNDEVVVRIVVLRNVRLNNTNIVTATTAAELLNELVSSSILVFLW